MRRLVAALREVQRLRELALDGKVLAAMELAEIYKVRSLRELLGVVCPHELPSPDVFDVCCDAFDLKARADARKRPTPALKLK